MIRFNFPFKCRKNIKRTILLLKRAQKLYKEPTAIKLANLIIVYDSATYTTRHMFSIYGEEYNLSTEQSIESLIKYCKFCLENNKIITYESYRKKFKKKSFNFDNYYVRTEQVQQRRA